MKKTASNPVALDPNLGRGDVGEGQRIGAIAGTVVVVVVEDGEGAVALRIGPVLMRVRAVDGAAIGLVPGNRHGEKRGVIPRGAVVECDSLDTRVRRLGELAWNGHGGTACEAQYHVRAMPLDRHQFRRRMRQAQRVGAAVSTMTSAPWSKSTM